MAEMMKINADRYMHSVTWVWMEQGAAYAYAYSSTLLADRDWGLILSVSQRHLVIVSQTGQYSMLTFRPKKNESTGGSKFKSRNPRTLGSIQEPNCRAIHMPQEIRMSRVIFKWLKYHGWIWVYVIHAFTMYRKQALAALGNFTTNRTSVAV